MIYHAFSLSNSVQDFMRQALLTAMDRSKRGSSRNRVVFLFIACFILSSSPSQVGGRNLKKKSGQSITTNKEILCAKSKISMSFGSTNSFFQN